MVAGKAFEQWRQHQSEFTFYGQLKDFIKTPHTNSDYHRSTYRYNGLPAIKDAIEAQAVPPGILFVTGRAGLL